jgi:predicted secreted protein
MAGEAEKPKVLHASVGELFDVCLAGTPTAGYTWDLDQSGSADLVEFLGVEYLNPPTDTVGGSTVQVFHFRAQRPGETLLRFRYGRRWEQQPLRVKAIAVVSQ